MVKLANWPSPIASISLIASTKMGFFKRKKRLSAQGGRGSLSSLQQEAESARVGSTTRLLPQSVPETCPPRESQHSPPQQLSRQSSGELIQSESSQRQSPPEEGEGQEGQGRATAEEVVGMDLLDPGLIGRTIKIVKSDDWEEDLIHLPDKETQILYENQRG
jgi:hypothetical protein